MLYYVSVHYRDIWSALRVLQYPSFRIPAAALTGLLLTLLFFPRFIDFLKLQQGGLTKVREDTPQQHQKKHGTPTMGGLFLVLTVFFSSLLWADLSNALLLAVLMILIGFGMIGFADDYLKISKKNTKGLAGKKKLFWQWVVLSLVFIFLTSTSSVYSASTVLWFDSHISLPFVPLKRFYWDIGYFYLPFAYLVIMGTSHALNLTDGLDGLAIGPTIVSGATFLILSYITGLVLTIPSGLTFIDFNVADYLKLPHVQGTGELAVLCAAICGSGIGFLWYNSFPASVFMGDVGSLSLGGTLGAIAVLSKQEFLSAIIHGVFLMEALSVITQVISFKLTKKRIFKMAPIHHHFELKGWPEPKIIVRFWIVAIVLSLIALTSLKLR